MTFYRFVSKKDDTSAQIAVSSAETQPQSIGLGGQNPGDPGEATVIAVKWMFIVDCGSPAVSIVQAHCRQSTVSMMRMKHHSGNQWGQVTCQVDHGGSIGGFYIWGTLEHLVE